jgi:hypothetical protein
MTPRRLAPAPAVLTLLALLLTSMSAPAQPPIGYGFEENAGYEEDSGFAPEFSLGIGYSRIVFSGTTGNVLDDMDAVHFNPALSFSPLRNALPQLRLGTGFGFSAALEDVGGLISSGGGGVIILKGDTALYLFEPEVQLSWHQPLGPPEWGFFLEPGVAAGGVIGWIDADATAFHEAGGTGDPDEWDAVFSARVFLRGGLHMGAGFGGLEASWLRAQRLDFGDNTGGDLGQFYIGVFGAIRF